LWTRNEPSGSIRSEEYLDQLSNYWLLNKISSVLS
jgi:hypothetical protein